MYWDTRTNYAQWAGQQSFTDVAYARFHSYWKLGEHQYTQPGIHQCNRSGNGSLATGMLHEHLIVPLESTHTQTAGIHYWKASFKCLPVSPRSDEIQFSDQISRILMHRNVGKHRTWKREGCAVPFRIMIQSSAYLQNTYEWPRKSIIAVITEGHKSCGRHFFPSNMMQSFLNERRLSVMTRHLIQNGRFIEHKIICLTQTPPL